MYEHNTNLNYAPIFASTTAIAQEYPLGALPLSIRNAVSEMQCIMKAPLSMVANSALGAISLACQNVADVKLPHNKIAPSSLFFVTIADSGERKTSVDSIFMSGIEAHERNIQSEYLESKGKFEAQNRVWQIQKSVLEKKIAKIGADKNDDLENQLISLIKSKPNFPQRPHLIARDITPEALAASLRTSPSMGLMSNEAGSILNGRAAEQLPMLNYIWDGSAYSVSRKNGDDFVLSGARLTVSLMVQRKTFQRFLDGRGILARDNGFLARCLFAQPFSTQGTRHQFSIDAPKLQAIEHFGKRVSDVLLNSNTNTPAERQVLEFTPEALQTLIAYSNEIETSIGFGGVYQHIKDAASKSMENAARMAALFHIFEKAEGQISKLHVDGAIEICKWHLNEFRCIFDPVPKTPQFELDGIRLEKWLYEKYTTENRVIFERNRLLQYAPIRDRIRRNCALQFLMAKGVVCEHFEHDLIYGLPYINIKPKRNRRMIQFYPQNTTLSTAGF
jgi:hypothetical protein